MNRAMISHGEMFFGRNAIVKRIMNRLSGHKPQSISLVGERRIGKSSLLNYIRSPGIRMQHLKDPDKYFFVFIDFQQVRALGPDRLIDLLISEIQKQTTIDITGEKNFECFRSISEAVANEKFRLIFLFDEFEVVTRTPEIGPEVYSFLRSLANVYPVSFICVSGKNLKDLCATREISDSPFFNIFSNIRLGSLKMDEARNLICSPSDNAGFPLRTVSDQILSMGGLYPFFLQMACCSWFEFLENEEKYAKDYTSEEIPQEVLDNFREEAYPHFEFIMESLPIEENSIMYDAAERSISYDEENDSVNELLKKGYLLRIDNRIIPFSEEFNRFIKRFTKR